MLRQLGVAIQERLGNLEFKLELGDQSNAETIELFVSKAKALLSLAYDVRHSLSQVNRWTG